jgi:hypothetical protein
MRKPAALAVALAIVAGSGALFVAWRQGWIPGRAQGRIPPGPLIAEAATFELAVYYLEGPKVRPLEAVEQILAQNDFAIPTLHAGQEVEIDEDDIFDYILRHPDGTEEGNETGVIIEGLPGETRQE